MDILIIAVCAALCGVDSWVGMEKVARAKKAWFRTFLKLENGIPSLDTFGDVFAKIDGEVFQTRFMRWVETMFRVTKGQVVALDGKTLRGSHKRGAGKDAIHLVNAWAVSTGIVMDVTFAEDRSCIRNEDSAENMAVLRSIALNLLKRDPSKSIFRQKQFRAAMDNDFLLHLIIQF